MDGDSPVHTDVNAAMELPLAQQDRLTLLAQIANASPAILYVYHLTEKRNLYCSPNCADILGYSPEYIQNMGSDLLSLLMHPDDLPTRQNAMQQIRNGESGPTPTEYRLRHHTGDWRWFDIRAVVFVRDDEDKPVLIVGTALDITERKRTETSLANLKARQDALLKAIPDIMLVQDKNGVFLECYASQQEHLLAPPEQFLGKPMQEILPAEIVSGFQPVFERAVQSGERQIHQYSLSFQGASQDFEARVVPVNDGAILSIIRNITEQKQTQRVLQEQKASALTFSERLQALIALTRDLSQCETTETLIYDAIKRGRAELGFDRLSLWFLEEGDVIRGSWGTDEQGCLRDEHNERVPIPDNGVTRRLLQEPDQTFFKDQTRLWDGKAQQVGEGSLAAIALSDGEQVFGFLSADNLLTRQPWTQQHSALLTLFGLTLGNLITQQRAEEELQRSHKRFEALIEKNAVCVAIMGIDGVFAYVSHNVETVSGYPPSEVVGRSPVEFIPPEDLEMITPDIDAILSQPGCTRHYSHRIRARDGSFRWLDVVGTNLSNEPAIGGVVLNFRDITSRKQMQDALQASQQRLNAIFNNALSAMILTTDAGDYIEFNPAACKMLGYERDELLSRNISEVIHPPPGSPTLSELRTTFIAQGKLQGLIRLKRKGGSFLIAEFSAVANVLPGIHLTMLSDVSEREQATQALRESEASAREYSQRLHDLLAVTRNLALSDTLDTLSREAILKGRSELGFDRLGLWLAKGDDEATGLWGIDEWGNLRDERDSVITVGVNSAMNRARKEAKRRVVTLDAPLFDHNARTIGKGTHTVAALWNSEQFVGYLCADNYLAKRPWTEQDSELLSLYASELGHLITRKRMEDNLRESEVRFRLIADTAPIMIFMTDSEGACIFVNKGWTDFTGIDAEAAFGYGWGKPVHPEDYAAVVETSHTLLKSRQVYREEYRMRRHDGQYRHVLAIGTPRYSNTQEFLGYVGSMLDITEFKAMQTQLFEANKLESLGRLAGGIAHDFNNLLTVILGSAEMMQDSLSAESDCESFLNNIIAASTRAADLTRQLLMYARRQMVEFQLVDINALIEDMVPLMQHTIGVRYELVTKLTHQDCCAQTNASQIEQVLLNLVINARDAMPDGGRICIETSTITLDSAYVSSHIGVSPGEYVLFTVSDTGVGMTREVQERIFDPFFTTKELGKGTGLGLATCYGIIKQSKGNIWVYSEPEIGTAFKVYLPRVVGIPAARMLIPQDSLPGGTATVLIVDDEPMVRDIAARILKEHGFRVLEAKNGADALLVQNEWSRGIDLLLTDAMMPLMGGKELADRLKKLRPEIRVLFMSGYTADVIQEESILDSSVPLLSKPFSAADLIGRVNQALQRTT